MKVTIRVPKQAGKDKNGEPLMYGFYDTDAYNDAGELVSSNGIVSVRNPELFEKFITGLVVILD